MDIQELIEKIKECGEILLKYRSSFEVSTKEDGGVVTQADIEANQFLVGYFKQKYPSYGIMSEELDKEYKENTWYIDPLNGTKAYIKGNDSFNILVGLVRNNKPILGIIYHPISKTMYIGGEEEKVRVMKNGKEEEIKKGKHTEQNLLFTPSENWENVFSELFKNDPKYTLVHRDKLGEEFKDPRINIVEGKINLQINSNFGAWGTWDICAGHAILSASGGVMKDYYGNDIDYSKPMLEKGFITADNEERIKTLPWINKQ